MSQRLGFDSTCPIEMKVSVDTDDLAMREKIDITFPKGK